MGVSCSHPGRVARNDGPIMARLRSVAFVCTVAVLAGGATVAAAQPTGEVVADRFARPQTPTVAVGPSGRAVVAWVSRTGSRFVVRARVRASRTAPWAPPAALSQRTVRAPSTPVAAVAGDGHHAKVTSAEERGGPEHNEEALHVRFSIKRAQLWGASQG